MSKLPSTPIGAGATAGVLACYFLVAVWGGELLGAAGAPAPLIWPASGIGLALVLARGARVWPLIFAVAVAASMLTLDGLQAAHVGGALLNGATAALEPVFAAWLMRRVAGAGYLERAGPFLLAVLIAIPAACFVSAVPLALGQMAGGLVTTYSWIGVTATWHAAGVADLMGMLTLAPPLLLWLMNHQPDLTSREAGELAVLGAAAGAVLATPAPDQARYLLVAAHLAIAMRLPLKWTATAVSATSMIYLLRSTIELQTQPSVETYILFQREVVFAYILNVATYVTALLQREARERTVRIESLARELSDAEHHERRRIAQTLHDHFQQLLVAAGMAVSRLRRGDASAGDQAEQLIQEATENARDLSVELHPPILDALGLAAAMRWLADDAGKRYGLQVRVETGEQADADLPEISSFVFQATRELLLNVVKHSGSDVADLRLHRTEGWLEVQVEDYGLECGPHDVARTSAGRGVSSIRERVELLGGRFAISGAQGCRITLILPVADAHAGRRDRR